MSIFQNKRILLFQSNNKIRLNFQYLFDMSNNTKKISVSPHLQFRQDINGIRGIAILLVVISHGWWSDLPSGKIGVDIFFVISGYLISSIIFRERSKGVYTIWKFYSRRIKRLTPALVFFLGYMIYLMPTTFFAHNKQRMRQEGSHIMASILMAENLEHIRMDFNNQYNSTVTTHLWSLGIQEQFYIFWPLVTGLIFKLNVKLGSIVIVGLACLSLWFQFHLQAAYSGWRICRFLPFTRFWQFLVGCLLAYVQFKNKETEINEKNAHQQHQMIEPNQSMSDSKQSSGISQRHDEPNDKIQSIEHQKSVASQRLMENSEIIHHKQFTQNQPKKEETNYIQDFVTPKIFLIVLRQIIPFFCIYVIYTCAKTRMVPPHITERGVQHAGFTYVKPVLATGILILTKNSFFNRRILGAKLLQFCGDVSYPLYLWHAGLEMSYNNFNNVLVQIYVPALLYACISMEFVEPFFRRNEQKWVIPFLILAQIIVFYKAYEIYKANL